MEPHGRPQDTHHDQENSDPASLLCKDALSRRLSSKSRGADPSFSQLDRVDAHHGGKLSPRSLAAFPSLKGLAWKLEAAIGAIGKNHIARSISAVLTGVVTC